MKSNICLQDDIEHKNNKIFKNDGLDNKKAVSEYIRFKNLDDFIEANKSPEGSKQETHMVWVGDAKREGVYNKLFKVEDRYYEQFISLYTKECVKNYGKMGILEKPLEIGPLILDYDLKQISPERKIKSDDIMQVIEIINEIIRKYYNITDDDIMISYVLMKKSPFYVKEKTCYSDGFHVHYPNLILTVEERFLIFEESKNEIIRQNLFSEVFNILSTTDNLKKTENNDDNETENIIEDDYEGDNTTMDNENIYDKLDIKEKDKVHKEVFDSQVIIKNKWFLYASGKNIGGKFNLYELKYIFDSNAELISDIPDVAELINVLAIRWNRQVNVKQKRNSTLNDALENIKNKYINKSNKIDFGKIMIKNEDDNDNNSGSENLKYNSKNNQVDNKDKQYVKVNYNGDDNSKYKENEEYITNAKKLVKLLSTERAYSYSTWIIVGWALYEVDISLLPEFIEFSKRVASKFKHGECEKIWKSCMERTERNEKSGYTIGSLYHWAKEDNPEGYKKFLTEKINLLLDSGNLKADYDVAYIIYTMYKYEYVCSSISKNQWWQFKNHRWRPIEEAYTLSQKMSEEVSRKFAELAATYFIQSNDDKNTGQKSDFLRQKATAIGKLVENLKSSSFKKRIMGECSGLFYDEYFEENLDQNNYLVGFNNGVFDLQTGYFRNGHPDDLISKTTKYDFREFKDDDHVVKTVEKFIDSIQPEFDMKKFVLCYCASLWQGGNRDQKFMVWTGSGCNGKGTLIDLIKVTMGEYFYVCAPTFLTQKRGSSSQASPDLAKTFGVRFLVLQEPEGNDKINTGFMKNVTGGDQIQARKLYGEPFEFTPQFKLSLICNNLPSIPEGGDGGVWRRVRVIDFKQKFVIKPIAPNELPLDPSLREKIPTWNKVFAWMLLRKYYPEYKKCQDIDEITPSQVFLSTNDYKKDTNFFEEFMGDVLELGESYFTDKLTLWELFKGWYTQAWPSEKAPPQKTLFKFLKDKGFEPRGSIVKGIRVKEEPHRVNDIDV
jgi:P4 family phage/plasmid primase-like protien